MTGSICIVLLFFCVAIETFVSTWAYPSNAHNHRTKRSVDVENPEDVFNVLIKLAQDVVDSDAIILSEKRGIDFGMTRGQSGQQAAKHLLALEKAKSPTGPGRRRRGVGCQ